MVPPTLLITRPEPQASYTAAYYTAQGWDCIISPAIITMPHPDAHARITVIAAHCEAWIVTSGLALELLEIYYKTYNATSSHPCPSPSERGIRHPLYVTGEVLAKRARDAGFHDVSHGGGSAQGVLAFLRIHGNPKLHYGYLHSNHQTLPLVNKLRIMGWNAIGTEIYQSHPAPSLSKAAYTALQQGRVKAISFYSTMTLQSFLMLVAEAGVQQCLHTVDAWCYSDAIAQVVPAGLFSSVKSIDIASSP